MALNTPISLVCWKMFADILALKEKRHRNIVIAMITSKISFKSLSTFAKEFDVVGVLTMTSKVEGSEAASAFYNSMAKA
jgi:hypothetical protein